MSDRSADSTSCACGAEIAPDDTWCIQGGHPVVHVPAGPPPRTEEPPAVPPPVSATCPNCGRRISAEADVCDFCDHGLREVAAGPAASIVLADGTRIRVDAEAIELGRLSTDPRIAAAVDRDEVSRQHARVRFDGTTAWLADTGSTNGTWIGDRRISGEIRLALGTTAVRLGRRGAEVAIEVT